MIGPSDFYEIMAKSPPNIELNKNVTETFSGLADFSLITVIVTVQPILRWGGVLLVMEYSHTANKHVHGSASHCPGFIHTYNS